MAGFSAGLTPDRCSQQRVPVVVGGGAAGERRVRAVVDHFAGALHRAGGEEVQAHAAGPDLHVAGVHPMPAQLAADEPAQRVVRQRADHRHRMAQVGQRHAHVGLRTAGMHRQLRALQQQLAARCAHAQQQLSETDNTTHGGGSL
jgi:hypothetical protein